MSQIVELPQMNSTDEKLVEMFSNQKEPSSSAPNDMNVIDDDDNTPEDKKQRTHRSYQDFNANTKDDMDDKTRGSATMKIPKWLKLPGKK